EPGDGPSQFNLPHGIWVDRKGRVLVADRQNRRIQLFTQDGEFLEEWTGLQRPCDIYMNLRDRIYIPDWSPGSASSTPRAGSWPAGEERKAQLQGCS
ncbi:MAG: hypothetical protein JSV18_06880, partial [Candidatus Bathyarchaeota archaeon]